MSEKTRSSKISKQSVSEEDMTKTVTLDPDTIKMLTESISSSITAQLDKKLDNINLTLSSINNFQDKCIKRLNNVEVNHDLLEQYTRRNNIRIFGLSEGPNENVDLLVTELFTNKLNVRCSIEDIERAHRIGQVTPDKERPVIVKFVSYRKRDEVIKKRMLLKGTKVIIREDLTKLRLELLKQATLKYGPRKVWTRDGNIYCIENNQKKKISTFADV